MGDFNPSATVGDVFNADPASVSVRAALAYTPTVAEAIWWDSHESGPLDQPALDWLLSRGVAVSAMSSPVAIRMTRVAFDGSGQYAPAAIGDSAFMLPVIGAGGLVDIAAWAPVTGQIGTRMGVGALLGGELVGGDTGDGVTVPPLRVFRSPLDWLRAGRCGAVILDQGRAAFALAGIVIEAADASHADELRRLRVPPPFIRRARTEGLAA